MKKRMIAIAAALAALLASISLIGFTSEENFAEQEDNPCRYSSASAMTEEGWLYVFDYWAYEKGAPHDVIDIYNFQCINLRDLDESRQLQLIDSPYLVYACSRSTPDRAEPEPIPLNSPDYLPDNSSDMAVINNQILTKDKTAEELLALSPDDLDLAFIDEELFLSLLQEALSKDTVELCAHQPHLDGIAYGPALLVEPDFADGYRFQAAYYNTVLACETEGCVQHLYIDVQYETDDGYVQLSDLVLQGTATDAQVELYRQLRSIADAVTDADDYSADAEIYRETVVDGLELSRLADLVASIADTHL